MGNNCTSELCANKDANALESTKKECENGVRGPGLAELNSQVFIEDNKSEYIDQNKLSDNYELEHIREKNLNSEMDQNGKSISYREKNISQNDEIGSEVNFKYDYSPTLAKKIENNSGEKFYEENNKDDMHENWYGNKEQPKQKQLDLSNSE